MAITLGQKVRDCITGYKGIAISRITYLVGQDQIGVQAECPDDANRFEDTIFLNEDRLIASSVAELQELKGVATDERTMPEREEDTQV